MAEIVLNYVDEKMINFVTENPSLIYLRYVDDIKLFATSEDCGKRALAYLDLLSRDLGLIPQSSKLGIKVIENKNELVKDNKKISKISIQYKKKGKIKESQNRKLIDDIKKDLNFDNFKNKSYDKSLLKFAMYKVKPDNELKNILIDNITYLYVCFEDICYYLSKNFIENPDVKIFVYRLLTKRDTPYNYLIAMIFKYFHSIIDFDIKIYEKYYKEIKNRDWYIRYFMLDWIKIKNPYILNIIFEDNNPIIKRKLDYYKYLLIEDKQTKELIIQTLMRDRNIETALLGQGLLNMNMNFWEMDIDKNNANFNEFIKRINNVPISENYISVTLSKYYGISNGNYFFNNEYWDKEELDNINIIFRNAHNVSKGDNSIWISYINTFNHLVTVKLLEIHKIKDYNKKEFNNILNRDNFMVEFFPKTYDRFTKINRRRNEIPLSHPYDKEGRIGKYINEEEKTMYEKLFKEAVGEILSIFEGKVNSVNMVVTR